MNRNEIMSEHTSGQVVGCTVGVVTECIAVTHPCKWKFHKPLPSLKRSGHLYSEASKEPQTLNVFPGNTDSPPGWIVIRVCIIVNIIATSAKDQNVLPWQDQPGVLAWFTMDFCLGYYISSVGLVFMTGSHGGTQIPIDLSHPLILDTDNKTC